MTLLVRCATFTKQKMGIQQVLPGRSAVGVSATECSFPYTYLGGLYYSCIQNVTGFTTDQCPYACLLENRTWALCVSDTGKLSPVQ